MGSNVPSPITSREHVSGCPLGHSTPGIHHHRGTYLHDFPSNYSSSTCTLLRNQIVVPFTWPDSMLAMARRWSCWDLWRATLPEAENGMSLKKLLKGGQQEALAKDSDLVQKARETYFRTNCPDFDCEVSHDLPGLFWEMTAYVDLLDSKIYEIQEVWTRQEDLQYANDALKLSPKDLWFFCPVSPSESPKVMGLKGVHHPEVLCCFARLTFCPGCGKEGWNEGMVVNHLQIMHYKLELVFSRCLHFPSIISEAIWHHGWGCKQPTASDVKEEDGGLMMYPCQTNQPQPSPLAGEHSLLWWLWCKHFKTLTLQDTHTFSVFIQFSVIVFTMFTTLYKSTLISNFTTFVLL